MAQIVLGMGTSHTPMLNAPPEDWPRFIERDTRRTNLLDVEGRPTTYEAQLQRAPADIDEQISPGRMRARHAAVEAAMARLGEYLRDARLDALIVVGDDQDELYHADNMPGFLVYYGEAIANVPLKPVANPDWGWRAGALVRGKGATRLPGGGAAGAAPDRRADRPRIRHRHLRPHPARRRRRPCARLRPQADHEGRRADRAGLHQYVLPAEPADSAALLQIRSGAPRRSRIVSRERAGRHHRLGGLEPFRRRRGARPRLHRVAAGEGRCRDPGCAAPEAEFRKLGNPQLDLRRRRGRTPAARMVALRARLPHPGRDRHRPRFRFLVVRRTSP